MRQPSCEEFAQRPVGWTRPQTDAEVDGRLTSISSAASAENPPGQWLSRCVSWVRSISVTWELVGNASVRPHARSYESDTLVVGPHNVV